MNFPFSFQQLFDFVDLAGRSTYASGKPTETISEREGFTEYTFAQGPWNYRDSYAGFSRSTGQEIVWHNGTIVWANSYCGGMVAGKEQLSDETFMFLKQALSKDEAAFQSLRGPSLFIDGSWKYTYSQIGAIDDFSGYEEILFQNEKIFFHRAIGGIVKE